MPHVPRLFLDKRATQRPIRHGKLLPEPLLRRIPVRVRIPVAPRQPAGAAGQEERRVRLPGFLPARRQLPDGAGASAGDRERRAADELAAAVGGDAARY